VNETFIKWLSAKCWRAKPIMRVCLDTSKQRLFTVRSAKRCCHWILAWCVLLVQGESLMSGTHWTIPTEILENLWKRPVLYTLSNSQSLASNWQNTSSPKYSDDIFFHI
jgi:hypothetical protein